jgi:phosphoribosylformimino-5-aminoimidazole carboxamide ribotide isomerase
MIILPAMDLMEGRVVRLKQGRFDSATVYPAEPAEALRGFADAGAEWAHIVDLEGARARAPVQHDFIARLAAEAPLKLQVAGGFRTAEQVGRMLDGGAARVVIGSLAVQDPERVTGFLDEFGPERIALALDVNMVDGEPMVATSGWAEGSTRTLWDIAALYPSARHLLATDIGRDGMLSGPNFDLYAVIADRLPQLAVQASGGMSSLDDLSRLSTAAAILGKAMWEGRVDLREAIQLGRA